jgi:hypothetical protein
VSRQASADVSCSRRLLLCRIWSSLLGERHSSFRVTRPLLGLIFSAQSLRKHMWFCLCVHEDAWWDTALQQCPVHAGWLSGPSAMICPPHSPLPTPSSWHPPLPHQVRLNRLAPSWQPPDILDLPPTPGLDVGDAGLKTGCSRLMPRWMNATEAARSRTVGRWSQLHLVYSRSYIQVDS